LAAAMVKMVKMCTGTIDKMHPFWRSVTHTVLVPVPVQSRGLFDRIETSNFTFKELDRMARGAPRNKAPIGTPSLGPRSSSPTSRRGGGRIQKRATHRAPVLYPTSWPA